jgi:hypothetical protein
MFGCPAECRLNQHWWDSSLLSEWREDFPASSETGGRYGNTATC